MISIPFQTITLTPFVDFTHCISCLQYRRQNFYIQTYCYINREIAARKEYIFQKQPIQNELPEIKYMQVPLIFQKKVSDKVTILRFPILLLQSLTRLLFPQMSQTEIGIPVPEFRHIVS